MPGKSFIRGLQWVVFALHVVVVAQQQQIDMPLGGLPYDEHTAQFEVSEGRLDSAVWEKVKPFYEEPLSVPLGELRNLREAFPELPDDIPTTPEVLARYEPWTDENVALFFSDYPYLIVFKPLLRFEITKMPVSAHCSFAMRRSGFSDAFNQSLRFGVSPHPLIMMDGSVTIGESYSRWQRRRIVLNFPKGGGVQLGNVDFSMNNGLFYGYFPLIPNTYEKSTENWLYGTSRTWNGIATENLLGEKCKISALIHVRESESIAGIKTNVTFTPRTKWYAALSGAISEDKTQGLDSIVGVHSGLTASIGSWGMMFETGINLLHLHDIPFYSTLSYNHTGRKYQLSCIRMPANFSAPRSSLLHTFISRLNLDDQVYEDIYAVLLSSRNPLFVSCVQAIDASYLVSGENADCRASYSLSGKQPFIYTLYYGLDAELIAKHIRHRLKGVVEHRGKSGTAFVSSLFYETDEESQWSIGFYGKIDISLFTRLCLSPIASFTIDADREEDYMVGLQQRIYFFEKTFGEATVTVPLHSQNNEHVSFYAKAHFLF